MDGVDVRYCLIIITNDVFDEQHTWCESGLQLMAFVHP